MDTIHTFDPLLVKLDSFEGPLDLLLHLIQDKKLDIHTLSLATLCAPFLSYVKNTSQIQSYMPDWGLLFENQLISFYNH